MIDNKLPQVIDEMLPNLDATIKYLNLDNEDIYTILNCAITEDAFAEMFQGGSVLYADGLMLYFLIRVLRPIAILELGTFIGTSTKFIVNGIIDNEAGHVCTIDRSDDLIRELHGKARGANITIEESAHVTMTHQMAQEYLANCLDNSVDFIFEDTDHTTETTFQILELAKYKLKSGGVFVSHDALMEPVQAAYKQSGIADTTQYLGAPCGLCIWRKP